MDKNDFILPIFFQLCDENNNGLISKQEILDVLSCLIGEGNYVELAEVEADIMNYFESNIDINEKDLEELISKSVPFQEILQRFKRILLMSMNMDDGLTDRS